MLVSLKFSNNFIKLAMTCVTTPKCTLMVNGIIHGYFHSKRGLIRGDPISHLPFVISMEYLSRLMNTVQDHPRFNCSIPDVKTSK